MSIPSDATARGSAAGYYYTHVHFLKRYFANNFYKFYQPAQLSTKAAKKKGRQGEPAAARR
jgi:hypothetical protein